MRKLLLCVTVEITTTPSSNSTTTIAPASVNSTNVTRETGNPTTDTGYTGVGNGSSQGDGILLYKRILIYILLLL